MSEIIQIKEEIYGICFKDVDGDLIKSEITIEKGEENIIHISLSPFQRMSLPSGRKLQFLADLENFFSEYFDMDVSIAEKNKKTF